MTRIGQLPPVVEPQQVTSANAPRPVAKPAAAPAAVRKGPVDCGQVAKKGQAAATASLIAVRPHVSEVAVRMSKRVVLEEAGWLGVGGAAGAGLGAYIARSMGAGLKSGSAWKVVAAGAVAGLVIFGLKGWESIKEDQAKAKAEAAAAPK